MKILLGLCALLFAGHSMATCSVATLQGSYIANAEGDFLNAASFAEAASADVHGDGTATAQIYYSIGGIPASSLQNATYTVVDAPDGSGNCVVTFTATLGGLPVSFKGTTGPSGDKMYTVTTLLGTSIHGVLERAN